MEVRRVKRFEGGIVFEPITIEQERTIGYAKELKTKHKISGFPVVSGKKLVGIITNRDVQASSNDRDLVKSFMTPIKDLITMEEGASFEKARKLLFNNRIEKLPIVNSKGELKGLITVKDLEKRIAYPNASRDSEDRLSVGAAIGVGKKEIERAEALIEAGVDCIVIDTAHGHSKGVLDTVREFKKKFKEKDLIAGNIATADAAEALIAAGADTIKVGIGPGSICTTRIVAGVGMPQLTAVYNCSQVAKKKKVFVVADGGIKYSGDITKAIAAGADTIMIGSLFAGTDEAPGEIFLYQGRTYKGYRGMGSLAAMKKGSKERYCQDHITETEKFVQEGIEGRVTYSGKIEAVIHQLVGGLRSGMGYVGCRNIRELQTKARFVKISPAGLKESHVHDVIITKEAPNYRME